MFDLFIRGLLMDAAGDTGGGGGVAVAEPSSDFGGDTSGGGAETTTTEIHDAEFVDPDPGAQTEQQQTSTALVKAGERAIQNGRFTQSGRAAIDALKQISPQLAQEATQALLTRDWFRKEFPGGKREIAALRQLAEQHGGEAGIAKLKGEHAFFTGLDELFSGSDPRFWDEVTTTEDERNALIGLMGSAFDKFEKLDGKQFGYQLSKKFVHLMDTARVPVIGARIVDLLNRAGKYAQAGNHEFASSFIAEIVQSYNELADVLAAVYTTAQNSPARQGSAADPKLDDRARQLSEREKALQKQEWTSAVAAERKRLFSKAWGEVTKGRTLTADQDSTIKGFYELRMNAKIRNWQNQAERFMANGDKDGFLREQFAFFQKAIPEALRQAIQQALPSKPGPKQAAGGPVKPPVQASRGTANGKTPVRVAKMPPTSDLDPVRTTGDMLSNNTAYRKDGTLVAWA